jgi:hypothetical protein
MSSNISLDPKIINILDNLNNKILIVYDRIIDVIKEQVKISIKNNELENKILLHDKKIENLINEINKLKSK